MKNLILTAFVFLLTNSLEIHAQCRIWFDQPNDGDVFYIDCGQSTTNITIHLSRTGDPNDPTCGENLYIDGKLAFDWGINGNYGHDFSDGVHTLLGIYVWISGSNLTEVARVTIHITVLHKYHNSVNNSNIGNGVSLFLGNNPLAGC